MSTRSALPVPTVPGWHSTPVEPIRSDGPLDAIVTAVSGYRPADMAVWFNSLKATGFAGRIFVVAYDVDAELVHWMEAQGAVVFTYRQDGPRYRYSQLDEELADHLDGRKLRVDGRWTWTRRILRFRDKIHDRRFFHSSELLRDHAERTGETFRFLAFSDARDVAFQGNPFDWIAANLPADKDLLASVEGITHDDPWNHRMTIKAFGKHALRRVAGKPVICCGFFAGRFEPMLELMLANYYFDQSKRIGDQIAFNQLLSFGAFGRITLLTDWQQPWTLHACTLMEPSKSPGAFADPATLPRFEDGVVLTRAGERFAVIHHYDRAPAVEARFKALYGTP
ncbi:hypothetical protein [Pannonibacter tanglangensis]|uniref:Uncharacterized protein n=1 Tax=Pannonibacter tanglangensis TaxID=2750084 RepID=A0ABW9ZNW9_9HYPH|nr:hypothetical protein [Pannonibacter sp. XCT-34]NBN66016.1 hypothetical protein [Pannonibacter sp. XCT-34]